jgi:hypothetical protein
VTKELSARDSHALLKPGQEKRHGDLTQGVVIQSATGLAGLALINAPILANARLLREGDEVVPWLDQPTANPAPQAVRNLLRWEDLKAPSTLAFRFSGEQTSSLLGSSVLG